MLLVFVKRGEGGRGGGGQLHVRDGVGSPESPCATCERGRMKSRACAPWGQFPERRT